MNKFTRKQAFSYVSVGVVSVISTLAVLFVINKTKVGAYTVGKIVK